MLKKLWIIISWITYLKWRKDKPWWLTLRDVLESENKER
jgi:hypothetical protein